MHNTSFVIFKFKLDYFITKFKKIQIILKFPEQHGTAQGSTGQRSAVQQCPAHHNTVRHRALPSYAQHRSAQVSTLQGTAKLCTAQVCTGQRGTKQYSPGRQRHSTVPRQLSTARHVTAVHSSTLNGKIAPLCFRTLSRSFLAPCNPLCHFSRTKGHLRALTGSFLARLKFHAPSAAHFWHASNFPHPQPLIFDTPCCYLPLFVQQGSSAHPQFLISGSARFILPLFKHRGSSARPHSTIFGTLQSSLPLFAHQGSIPHPHRLIFGNPFILLPLFTYRGRYPHPQCLIFGTPFSHLPLFKHRRSIPHPQSIIFGNAQISRTLSHSFLASRAALCHFSRTEGQSRTLSLSFLARLKFHAPSVIHFWQRSLHPATFQAPRVICAPSLDHFWQILFPNKKNITLTAQISPYSFLQNFYFEFVYFVQDLLRYLSR